MSVQVVFTASPDKGEEMRQWIEDICNPFAVTGTAHKEGADPFRYEVHVDGDGAAVTLLLDLGRAKAWNYLLSDPRVVRDSK